jgi:hypothetical protein
VTWQTYGENLEEKLKDLHDKRRRIAAEPFAINQNTRTVKMTISIGIAAMRSSEDTPAEIGPTRRSIAPSAKAVTGSPPTPRDAAAAAVA